MLTCVHTATGLCPACRTEWEADPRAFEEFGLHTAGIARWRELLEEMEGDRLAELVEWNDVPF